MGWRIVVQPNGLYARFSDIVDNFTDYDMTRDEAFELCRDLVGAAEAERKIDRAERNRQRFNEEIDRIMNVHGNEEADYVRKGLSNDAGTELQDTYDTATEGL